MDYLDSTHAFSYLWLFKLLKGLIRYCSHPFLKGLGVFLHVGLSPPHSWIKITAVHQTLHSPEIQKIVLSVVSVFGQDKGCSKWQSRECILTCLHCYFIYSFFGGVVGLVVYVCATHWAFTQEWTTVHSLYIDWHFGFVATRMFSELDFSKGTLSPR